VYAGRCHIQSDAVLEILKLLPKGWSLLGRFGFVPRTIRDRIYDLVSRKRYRWFGMRNVCRISVKGVEDRFLE